MRKLILALVVAALPLAARAESPEEKGLMIAKEAQRRDEGWVDSKVDAKMVLENKQGEKSERNMRIRALEVTSDVDGDKSLVYFLSPPDVQGTALLSFTHFTASDDQWLYLPALKRVKRIASANKSGSFVGSEFAFEDLLAQEVPRFTYKYLRDEPCPTDEAKTLSCFVVERKPAYEHSGYSRQIGWMDNKDYLLRKIEFFDRKSEHSKTLLFTNYRQYLGKFWRAQKLVMENHLTGKKTTLQFGDFQLNATVDQSEFDPDALSRLR
ncbi:MAG: outer membrane lipoprotein-sorting protein [Alphaproteobacteria bacterium]|nr:outer membrane lipoprotein-sorting protein [Alphaproteobacteria bacterium]